MGPIGKDKLVFDTSVALVENDNVGAYVRASDGTLITHHTVAGNQHLDVYSITADAAGTAITSTLIGGKQAMDVNVANAISINVDLNGIYDGSTNTMPDNVGIIGSSRAAPGLANQTLQFTGGGVASSGVSTSNIVAQDVNSFNMLWNGTTWDRATGSVAGGANVTITNTTVATVATAPNTAFNTAAVSVDNTVGGTALFASPLAARKSILVQNLGNKEIYVGETGVTTANGIRIAAGGNYQLELGPALALYGIAGSAAVQNVRVLQVA